MAVEFGFAEFFGAAVEVADVGFGADDALAVDPDDDAKDAVGAGVLRAHVDHKV